MKPKINFMIWSELIAKILNGESCVTIERTAGLT